MTAFYTSSTTMASGVAVFFQNCCPYVNVRELDTGTTQFI